MEIYPSINVYGKEIETCCDNPITGFFRNGLCDTCKEDLGVHTVCILATEDFLISSGDKILNCSPIILDGVVLDFS